MISKPSKTAPVVRAMMPRDYIRVIFQHKVKVLLWCGCIAGVAYVSICYLPRKYESEAKLFIRLGRESVALDPTATTGATMQVQETREDQINSARDMLKSRALLDQVVEKLGAETILKGASAAAPSSGASGIAVTASRWFHAVTSFNVFPPVSPREAAVSTLAKTIDVNVAHNSSVISIGCTAKSAKLAQEILQAFLDAYLEQHLKANSTAGSLDFFTAQATQLKQQLDTAVGKVRDAKNASSLVTVSAEQQAEQAQLTQVEASLLAAEAGLASSEATIANQRKSLADLPERVTTQETGGFPNVAADSMRQEFFKLQASIRDMEAKMQPDHPLLQAARDQTKALQKILDAQPVARTQTTTGTNTSHQSLELEMHREEAAAAAWRAKSTALKQQYADLEHRIQTLNEHEAQIAELETQAQIAQANFRSNAEHLEQARISEALGADRISNVNVIQPPSLEEGPISPKPTMILGLSLVAAVFGSIGLAYGSEALHDRSSMLHDVEPHQNGRILEPSPLIETHHVLVNR